MEQYELILIAVLVILQLFVFITVLRKIGSFKRFFPNDFNTILIRKFGVSNKVINDNIQFYNFLDNLKGDTNLNIEDGEDSQHVELLVVPDDIKKKFKIFDEVVKSTNSYLGKNKGSSADFNILQDICERQIQKLDNEISNLINVPLYIGLAGTFIGIIIGLYGIDLSAVQKNGGTIISPHSISQLLNGVISAMLASFIGLGFTVWNTALNYKPAAYQNDTNKNTYYDFLQRELLPVLNVGVAGSLTTFRSVLNHFIHQFGDNIGDYKDTAHLLNDNLHKQQQVLLEINKLSLTRTSNLIVKTFADLKESAEHLNKFQDYQKSLNENLDKANHVVQSISTTIDQFKDFNINLKAITNNTINSIELQKQFKESLENHFPTIADHRVVWRKQVDELSEDVKNVYSKLNDYFKVSTEQIQSYVINNKSFFSGLDDIQHSIKLIGEYSVLQKNEYEELRKEITMLRNDYRDSQSQTIALHQEIVSALKDLNKTMSKIEVVNSIKS